jgi:hypothetical protein
MTSDDVNLFFGNFIVIWNLSWNRGPEQWLKKKFKNYYNLQEAAQHTNDAAKAGL